MPLSNAKKFICIMVFTIVALVVFSLSMDSRWLIIATKDSQISFNKEGKVSVMYAASLLKTFEGSFGSSFQKETGYTYEGEARGSVQVANMIIEGLRRPDVFVSADTIPIMKLMNNTDNNGAKAPLAQ